MDLISELRRRNVFRMAVLYVVVAWLIMQVAEVIIALANLPEWAGPLILAVLAIGFPIALIFSWFYEITPEGLALEKDVDRERSITHVTGRRMDFVVISLLSAALLIFAWHTWWPSAPNQNSIAVLPFQNIGGSPQDDYLADGISEELIYLMSQSSELQVISRTSAFSFRNREDKLIDVARELNVAYILEGSVRNIGDRLRINAQLIDARSDTAVWTDTYERDPKNLFGIRDKIVGSVVAQLGLSTKRSHASESVIDGAAYDDFLQGLYWADQVHEQALLRAEEAFSRSLTVDPTFSDAWTSLGAIYEFRSDRGQIDREIGIQQARGAAARALELDPNNARAYALIGRIRQKYDFDWHGANEAYVRARELAPSDAEALRGSAHFAMTFGKMDQATELYEELFRLDPLSMRSLQNLALSRLLSGDYDESIALFKQLLVRDRDHPTANYLLAQVYLMQGKPDEAIEQAQKESVEPLRLAGNAIALWSKGDYEKARVIQSQLIEEYGDVWFYQIAQTYGHMEMSDEAFHWLGKALDHRDSGLVMILNDPLLESLHADSRWRVILEKLKLES